MLWLPAPAAKSARSGRVAAFTRRWDGKAAARLCRCLERSAERGGGGGRPSLPAGRGDASGAVRARDARGATIASQSFTWAQ